MITGPGTWLIFGVILVPVYAVFLGWFLGRPRNTKTAIMGVVYFVGLVAALWGGLFAKTVLIDLVFF